jgi:GH24 family phage-related lysozyme (muramidase)
MKRLLLLLILSPVLLFAQKRQRAIVDSIKAASTSLQNVSAAISKYPDTKVEDIRISDSNGYVTLVVRVHVDGGIVVPVLSPVPVAQIKSGDIVAWKLSTVTVPPLPPPVAEPDPLSLLAVFKLKTGDIPVVKLHAVTVPPLPYVKEEIDSLSLLAVFKLKARDIPVVKMDAVKVPPLPHVKDEIDSQSLLAVFMLKTGDIPLVKMDAVKVPPLPHVKEEIDSLSLLAVFKLKTEDISAAKMDAVTVPHLPHVKDEIDALMYLNIAQFRIEDIDAAEVGAAIVPPLPDIEPELVLQLVAAVKLTIENHPADKLLPVTVPVFEENRMAVEEMHLSDEGYALLEKLEGFSPELYTLKDGGFTIGFGFFVPYGEVGKWRKGVTWEEAEVLIRQKMPAYEDQVKRYINVPLTQEEFDALTMLAYNLGGFSKATSIVNDINNNADFEQLQHDWMRFVHSKAPGVMNGLMNRRRDEMRVRGESYYQPERKILVFKNRR